MPHEPAATTPKGALLPRLVHCSYHKCLTQYFRRVMTGALRFSGEYRHFQSDIESFYSHLDDYKVISVNNHVLDLDKLGEYRITRFVRDPRDLVVSGYHYHKRGAEKWTLVKDPAPADWMIVNGRIPDTMQEGESFSDCLQRLDLREGLLAEMEMRANHFESMRHWPSDDPHIRVWRYEDVIGNEERVFSEIFSHYEFPWLLRLLGRRQARRTKAAKLRTSAPHVRDPRPGQWRDVFPADVLAVFNERYGDVLERYGYE